jgi:excisionase family DNA binding protein
LVEVATRLNVSVETVRRIIKSGALKAAKVGGQLRVREEDLEEYIRKTYK